MDGDVRSSSDEISDSSETSRPLTNGTPKKSPILNNKNHQENNK